LNHEVVSIEWWLTMLMMALALGMDAFSMGLAISIRCAQDRVRVVFSAMVGLFHFLMPYMGMFFGGLVNHYIGPVAMMMAGGLLSLLGIHMFFQTTQDSAQVKSESKYMPFFTLLMLAFMVSMDSLSVGVTIGIIGVEKWLPFVLFAVIASMLSGFGLWLGKTMHHLSGKIAERIAALILFALGMKFLYLHLF
jgi:putative Mn2+ efflux pump MntP